jgi:Gluconate 2-dehydrogenase subunit 3
MESRRDFLIMAVALWQGASARAQEHRHAASGSAAAATPYRFVFLDPGERRTLRLVMDRMVPADERSAGAVGARVDEYVDFVLAHADHATCAIWRNGLGRYGRALRGKAPGAIDRFLNKQSGGEFVPRSEDEQFFVLLKTAVTEGFYTSEEGILKELGYQGMAFELDFPGCPHEEHSIPPDYKPMLRQTEEE